MQAEKTLDRDETYLINICYGISDLLLICGSLSGNDELYKSELNEVLIRAQFIATEMLRTVCVFPSALEATILQSEDIVEQIQND